MKLLIGNLATAGLLAVTAIVIARLLGPSLYGEYALIGTVPAVLQLFVGTGVNVALTKFVAYDLSKGDTAGAARITKHAVILIVGLGGLLTAATFLGASPIAVYVFHRPELTPYVQETSAVILGQSMMQAAIAAFVGWSSMGLASTWQTVQPTLKIVLVPALLVLGFGLFGAVIGNMASLVVGGAAAVTMLYVSKLRGVATQGGQFLADVREMVKFSIPVMSSDLVGGVALQYLTIILALSAANAVVGNFQAAMNFNVVITTITSAVASVLLPTFATVEGLQWSREFAMGYAVKYVAYAMTPVVFFLIASSGPIAQVLYGATFKASSGYLSLLAISYLPIAFGLLVLPPFFNGIHKPMYTMYSLLPGAALILVAAPALSIYAGLGADGLFISLLLANILTTTLGSVLLAKRLKVKLKYMPEVIIVACSVASFLPTAWLAGKLPADIPALVVEALVFVALYLTLVPVVGGIDLDDLGVLTKATKKLGPLTGFASAILTYEALLYNLPRKKK